MRIAKRIYVLLLVVPIVFVGAFLAYSGVWTSKTMTMYVNVPSPPDLVVSAVGLPYSVPILYESCPRAIITYIIRVNVTNLGPGPAGTFDVSLELFWVTGGIIDYYAEETVTGLGAGQSKIVNFNVKIEYVDLHQLNATADCNNDISETNETNNPMVLNMHGRLAGDIDGNKGVDYFDLRRLLKAYGSTSSGPYWDELADLNCNKSVDYFDLYILLKHYGVRM